jgi:AdoMet-dependent heme synthase
MTPKVNAGLDAPVALACGAAAAAVPRVPLRAFRSLWFQVTGTLCNLACRHCFNSSGPRDPWLRPLEPATVRAYLGEAERLGVRDVYFTGGEPLLHRDIFMLLDAALAVAPTTVLTNGTLIDDAMADRLAAAAASSPYSLEVRVSLDADTAGANDAIRGRGSFGKAVAAIQRLAIRRLYPIVTATDIGVAEDGRSLYQRLRELLLGAGVDRPRIKILPVLPLGRLSAGRQGLLTPADLQGEVDVDLPCREGRVVADGGVYACPILAGLPGAWLSASSLAEALRPAALYHPVCRTCYETGIQCRNT